MIHRRLVTVCLDTPISDPNDRGVMPMSTLIASHQWLMEASWDGAIIGDVQIFRNTNVGPTGAPLLDGFGTEVPPAWTWWNGVPRGKVKSYRFEDAATIQPMTVKHAEPAPKPKSAGQGRAPSAA